MLKYIGLPIRFFIGLFAFAGIGIYMLAVMIFAPSLYTENPSNFYDDGVPHKEDFEEIWEWIQG